MNAHTPSDKYQRNQDAAVANVTAVRYDTPSGVFYTFFCKHGNQHQTRVETANCSRTDGTKCAEEFRARDGAK